MITVLQLRSVEPSIKDKDAKTFLPFFNLLLPLPKYDITGRLRLAAFFSQILVESGNLVYTSELWGPTIQQGKYERDFNHAWPYTATDKVNKVAYSLGNHTKGDGRFFKGHGLIQVTGRANHLRMSKNIFDDERLLKVPDMLCLPKYAVQSACEYWKMMDLNKEADKGDIKRITIKVNGGLTHFEKREKLYNTGLTVFL